MTDLATIQRRVGVTPDGKWGPNTAAAILRALGPLPPKQLSNPEAFFARARPLFGGKLDPAQVVGINAKLKAMGAAAWPISYAAYGLATSFWETAKNMSPVVEAYWKDEAWRKANLRYYPWHGRGDVQTTWERNYRRADAELGLGGSLVANPDRMLEPAISADTMVRGMQEGWFTDKSLSDYLPATGFADKAAFAQARRIINGTDKADEIAAIAMTWQQALADGGWA